MTSRRKAKERWLVGSPVELMVQLADIFYAGWEPWSYANCVDRAHEIIFGELRKRQRSRRFGRNVPNVPEYAKKAAPEINS